MAPKKRKPTSNFSLSERANTKTYLMRQKEMVDRLFPVRSDIARFLDSKDIDNLSKVSKEVSRIPKAIPNIVLARIHNRASCAEITNNGIRCFDGVVFQNKKSGVRKNCRGYCMFFFVQQLLNGTIYLQTGDTTGLLDSALFYVKDTKTSGIIASVSVGVFRVHGANTYSRGSYNIDNFPLAYPDFMTKISELRQKNINITVGLNLDFTYAKTYKRDADRDAWFVDSGGTKYDPFKSNAETEIITYCDKATHRYEILFQPF